MLTPLHSLWQHLQRDLFPLLVEELGEPGGKDQQFVQVVSLLPLGPLLPRYDWKGLGCPPHARVWMIHAFIAKEVYQFATREALIDSLRARPTLRRLCGWESVAEIPSASTFCRAFARFAADELPQQIHEALIKTHCGPKLVGHVSRDSTAISLPERPPRPRPRLPRRAPRRRPANAAARAKGKNLHPRRPPACNNSPGARWRKTWPTSRGLATAAARKAPKDTGNTGGATSCTWT